jgi:hypothetical protein
VYKKNAPAAMATMPAANPSRPSMRLIAFAIPATQMMPTSGARSGDSETKSRSENGIRK